MFAERQYIHRVYFPVWKWITNEKKVIQNYKSFPACIIGPLFGAVHTKSKDLTLTETTLKNA